jgi:hypothetical protein
MPATLSTLAIRGLSKQTLLEIAKQAKQLGLTPEQFVKEAVEERLAIARQARSKTFAEIAGPPEEVDEAELDALVEKVRSEFHARSKR